MFNSANISDSVLNNIYNTLGYSFRNKNLIILAFTHSSYANETKKHSQVKDCNERLEFLGDSVLSLICADYIYRKFPEMSEGDMSKLRACAVESSSLAEYSLSLGLGEYLLLGRGEDNEAGRSRVSTLENTFEAVVAAIYLDGGISAANKFALPFISAKIAEKESSGEAGDFKTRLQQIIQMEHGEILEYVPVGESGPDHNKTYKIEARLNSNVIGTGEGRSKKAAEQKAAENALHDYFGQ